MHYLRPYLFGGAAGMPLSFQYLSHPSSEFGCCGRFCFLGPSHTCYLLPATHFHGLLACAAVNRIILLVYHAGRPPLLDRTCWLVQWEISSSFFFTKFPGDCGERFPPKDFCVPLKGKSSLHLPSSSANLSTTLGECWVLVKHTGIQQCW